MGKYTQGLGQANNLTMYNSDYLHYVANQGKQHVEESQNHSNDYHGKVYAAAYEKSMRNNYSETENNQLNQVPSATGGTPSRANSFDLGFGGIQNDSGIGLAAETGSGVEKLCTVLPWYFIAVVAGAFIGYLAMGVLHRGRDETQFYVAYLA